MSRIPCPSFDGLALLVCALALWWPVSAPAERPEQAPSAEDHARTLEDWKAERIAFLKGRDGYLNLVGLFWLKPGRSTFGSAPDNVLRFPPSAAARIGELELNGEAVSMFVHDGIDVRHGDDPVRRIILSDDSSGHPVLVTHGALAWTVIRRDDRFALRLRDYEHEAIEQFEAPPHYPADLRYRVPATLERYETPRAVRVQTVIEGLDYRPESPGVVRFVLDGQQYELEAYVSGERLFLVFGDLTNRSESYPAGRFLYADLPDAAGNTVLDFNRAHNPPCAFNEFATCPVASPRNRLPVTIAAGEGYDRSAH